MVRTRLALLDGAGAAVVAYGARATTMADIASHAGVAKATLYNHFRTKPEILAALADDAVARIADRLLGAGARPTAQLLGAGGGPAARPIGTAPALASALADAAEQVASHPAVVRLRETEPELLAVLAIPNQAAAWRRARSCLDTFCRTAGAPAGAAEVLLRWLASHVVDPADQAVRAAGAELLAAGLVAARLGQPA